MILKTMFSAQMVDPISGAGSDGSKLLGCTGSCLSGLMAWKFRSADFLMLPSFHTHGVFGIFFSSPGEKKYQTIPFYEIDIKNFLK